jgi:hypothetical protein
MRSLGPVLVVLALAPACRGRPKPEPAPGGSAPTSSAVPTEEPAAAASGSSMTARLARCGWGTVKAEPGVEAPPFAIALLDLDARSSVHGLHVSALELDTGETVVAKMADRVTLRVQEGAVSYSYGAADTHEVGSVLPAGAYRLRASAALDRPKKAILPKKPTRCAAVLASDDEQVVVRGNIDPEWQNE